VEQNATARQIQKAFRNVSLTLHPDKNPSPTAADEFRRIANAYEVMPLCKITACMLARPLPQQAP
jgi:DnaJ-class molecular chaperone